LSSLLFLGAIRIARVANPAEGGQAGRFTRLGRAHYITVTVYVIVGKENFRYIGITKDLRRRLREHNSGKSFSTKTHKPCPEIFIQKFLDYKAAGEQEVFLKSGIGRKYSDGLKS
jgi:putative endonuclease